MGKMESKEKGIRVETRGTGRLGKERRNKKNNNALE